MKIEIQPLEDHQVKIISRLEPDQFEQLRHQAARRISQKKSIPGFRPGKAPFAVVQRIFSDEAIREQAIEIFIDTKYQDLLKEADVKPYGPGSLEAVSDDNPPELTILVPLEPEAVLGNYREIRKEYDLPVVEEKEVDQYIQRMLTNYSTAEPVERAAAEGDMVSFKMEAFLVEPVEGKEGPLYKDDTAQIIMGDNFAEENNEPFEGFWKELLGAITGEKRKVIHFFPPDYSNSEIAGKEIRFEVETLSVKSLTLPELTDDFVKTNSQSQTVDEFRVDIRKGLESNKKREYDSKFLEKFLDSVEENSTIKYPPLMVDEEVEHILSQVEGNLARQNLDLQGYLKVVQKTKEDYIDKEIKPEAISRIRRNLIVEEMLRQEKLKLDQKKFQEELEEASNYFDLGKIKKEKDRGKMASNIINQTAVRVLNNQLLDRVIAIATGQSIEISSEETVEPAQEKTE